MEVYIYIYIYKCVCVCANFLQALRVVNFLCLRGIGYAAVLLAVVVCHLLSQMDPYTNQPIVWKGLGYTGPWSD